MNRCEQCGKLSKFTYGIHLLGIQKDNVCPRCGELLIQAHRLVLDMASAPGYIQRKL